MMEIQYLVWQSDLKLFAIIKIFTHCCQSGIFLKAQFLTNRQVGPHARGTCAAKFKFSKNHREYFFWVLMDRVTSFQTSSFSQIEPIFPTDQRIKIFLIMIKNSRSYSNFQFENLTPKGVNKTRFKKYEYFFLEIYITFIHFNKEKKKIKK